MQHVFIVGCSRTGSTLLQQVINKYTNIDILPEAHMLLPRWIHKDFSTIFHDIIGDINKVANIDKLISLMYSKEFYGVFWDQIEESNLDKKVLRKNLLDCNRTILGIFNALMKAHAKGNGKETLGAKFPVYIGYAAKLIKWFPECKVIHTIRDPRAIYTSQLFKRTDKSYSFLKNMVVAVVQFFHINIQFYWACKIHKKLNGKENYYLCKYEDIITEPEKTLKKLCNFLAIPFKNEMLKPRIFFNTSFANEKKVREGFQKTSIDAWKEKLPGCVAHFIQFIHRKRLMRLGY